MQSKLTAAGYHGPRWWTQTHPVRFSRPPQNVGVDYQGEIHANYLTRGPKGGPEYGLNGF